MPSRVENVTRRDAVTGALCAALALAARPGAAQPAPDTRVANGWKHWADMGVSLKGKTALITGSTDGLGKELADPQQLHLLKEIFIQREGGHVVTVRLDGHSVLKRGESNYGIEKTADGQTVVDAVQMRLTREFIESVAQLVPANLGRSEQRDVGHHDEARP